MRVSAVLPPGVAALLFAEARKRRRLESRIVSRLEAAGYEEVMLPILDYWEPYEPILPEGSRAELYRFVGRGGELLTLRADFTPMLARLLAPRWTSLPKPLRLYYRGDVVRYQEEQAGKMLEFYQIGAELLGDCPDADGECLSLFLRLLVESGAAQPQLVVGLAGALDELLLAAGGEKARELAAAVARRERGRVREASRALAAVVEEGRPASSGELGEAAGAALARLEELVARLQAAQPTVRIAIDLAEFAGLSRSDALVEQAEARSYYDGVVFRAFVGGRAVPVGGGGRYDSLFERLGAPAPAVGFSLGLDRLSQALPEEVA